MSVVCEFKKRFTLEQRKEECAKMLTKFPDRIPVIVERLPNNNLPSMDRKKFLVPSDIVLGQFIQIIRKRINLNPVNAIFTFIGEKHRLFNITELLSTIYTDNKDDDGFLYIYYTSENTFG
jgi:GABA(A) receptor-associated protein